MARRCWLLLGYCWKISMTAASPSPTLNALVMTRDAVEQSGLSECHLTTVRVGKMLRLDPSDYRLPR